MAPRKERVYEKLERPRRKEAEERPTAATAVAQPSPLTAAGNRALTRVVIARDTKAPPAPDAPAADAAMPEAEKERARRLILGPLRTASTQLEKREKANLGIVVRHVEPAHRAAWSIAWPHDQEHEVWNAFQRIDDIVVVLKSLKKDHRQVAVDVRHQWREALRRLKLFLTRAAASAKGDPDSGDVMLSEYTHEETVGVLVEQVEASIEDLARAPRTRDGYKDVADVAADVLHQLELGEDTTGGGGEVSGARGAFEAGLSALVTLAYGKDDLIDKSKGELDAAANVIAVIIGDAAPSADTDDTDTDPDPPPSPAGTAPPTGGKAPAAPPRSPPSGAP
jgi:hypothetical protein